MLRMMRHVRFERFVSIKREHPLVGEQREDHGAADAMQACWHEEKPIAEAVEVLEVLQVSELREDLLPSRDRRRRGEDAGQTAMAVEQDPAFALLVRRRSATSGADVGERVWRVVAQRDPPVAEITGKSPADVVQRCLGSASESQDVDVARL